MLGLLKPALMPIQGSLWSCVRLERDQRCRSEHRGRQKQSRREGRGTWLKVKNLQEKKKNNKTKNPSSASPLIRYGSPLEGKGVFQKACL